MTFKGVALELEGAFVFGTAPRYVILNLIQDPFRRLKAAFTSGTHPSIGLLGHGSPIVAPLRLG